jgi:hypothetical protein
MGEYLGVQYIYEEILNSNLRSPHSGQYSGQSERESPKLTVFDLQEMPQLWRQQINLAASQLDEDQILELIDQVSNGNLASGLRDLVSSFRFDKLFDLTKD